MTNINTIHTACKNCVFAQYSDITQTGCSLNYIDKFKENAIEILEAYDNDKEFYIINNKKCIGYIENKWFKQFGLENATLEEKVNKYHETNFLHYSVIINLKNYSINDLEQLINYISLISIKPQKITLIRYRDADLKFKFDKIQTMLSKYNISVPWRIQTMLENDRPYSDILHNFISINKDRFVLSISEPVISKDIDKVIDYTNNLVYHEMKSFYIISNSNYSATIFPTSIYKFAAFNKENILEDKTKYHIV